MHAIGDSPPKPHRPWNNQGQTWQSYTGHSGSFLLSATISNLWQRVFAPIVSAPPQIWGCCKMLITNPPTETARHWIEWPGVPQCGQTVNRERRRPRPTLSESRNAQADGQQRELRSQTQELRETKSGRLTFLNSSIRRARRLLLRLRGTSHRMA